MASLAGAAMLASEVTTTILSRAEGNPFFLEELARAAVDQGTGAEAIPETVHGVIMARLDRLPDVTKRLVQTASVLGREIPLRLLRRIWDAAADPLASLTELCRQEFIYERLAGDDPTYVFKHALTQDVAYDSLLARTRRDLHLRAAQALEELYADRIQEVTATIAYHYARTDRSEDAVTWLTRAADQAARVYANAEAILHLDLAARRLQRIPEGPERDRRMLDVALRHAHSLYFLGRFRESVEVLLPHDARVARLGDPSLTAAFSFWLAHMYSRLGDQRRAARQAGKAIEAAQQAGDDATRGKAHGVLALEGHWAGRPREGRAHGAIAVTLLQPQCEQQWWLGMPRCVKLARRTQWGKRLAIRACKHMRNSWLVGWNCHAATTMLRSPHAGIALNMRPIA
jgi:predicted ATPase